MLLMFAASIPVEQALEGIKAAGIVTNPETLEQIKTAWPAGEAVVDAGGRRLLVVAGADRFSDEKMGISEKVVPDAGQRALFNQAFGVIDRLFGRETPVEAKPK